MVALHGPPDIVFEDCIGLTLGRHILDMLTNHLLWRPHRVEGLSTCGLRLEMIIDPGAL